jgi:hypothetical protein
MINNSTTQGIIMQKRTAEYRQIYKKLHGEIPVDDLGRSYDIHHMDGDHTNNSPENLKAIPIEEHYKIHYDNSDWRACVLIGLRMKLTAEEISVLNSKAAYKRVDNGTHPWTTSSHANAVRERVSKAVSDGTYHMLGGEIQKKFQLERSGRKEHQWNGPSSNIAMLESGTHPSQKEFTCPHCNKTGKGIANGNRWHFDNCKQRKI